MIDIRIQVEIDAPYFTIRGIPQPATPAKIVAQGKVGDHGTEIEWSNLSDDLTTLLVEAALNGEI